MHRLQFSKEQYDKLSSWIESVRFIPSSTRASVIERYAAQHAQSLTAELSNIHQDPANEYENKQIYESIKRDLIPKYWQLIFHVPLNKIPLYLNHTDPLIVAIAKWRLDIAR